MTTLKEPLFFHTCKLCDRLLPEKNFMRMPTAARYVRKHEVLRSKNLDVSMSDVLEFTPEERAAAHEKSLVWAAKHSKKTTDPENPHALCTYKAISGRKEVSKTCLECKPQEPFHGDLSTTTGRVDAIMRGSLAPTLFESQKLARALWEKQRGPRAATGHAPLKKAIRKRLLALTSAELRSVRSKLYYLTQRPERATPELQNLLALYRSLVQAVHVYVRKGMPTIPALVWQLIVRTDLGNLSASMVLPTVALAMVQPPEVVTGTALEGLNRKQVNALRKAVADRNQQRHDLKDVVLTAWVDAQRADTAYRALNLMHAASLPYLSIGMSQADPLREMGAALNKVLHTTSPHAVDNESAPKDSQKYDRVFNTTTKLYEDKLAIGVVKEGIPRQRMTIEAELQRAYECALLLKSARLRDADMIDFDVFDE